MKLFPRSPILRQLQCNSNAFYFPISRNPTKNRRSLNYLLAPVILALTKVNGSQLKESPLLSAPIAAQARASPHLQSPINNCRAWDTGRIDSPGRRWIS
jgi:hypothetical protein